MHEALNELENGSDRFEFETSLEPTLDALADAADLWGGQWQRHGSGGRLVLPVTAGVRHGFLVGEVSGKSHDGAGAELSYLIEHSEYATHRGSVAVLLFGGIGAVTTIVAPLYPQQLWQLVPAGVLLMLVAWLLVASRVRHRSAEDFFRLVGEIAENDSKGSPSSED